MESLPPPELVDGDPSRPSPGSLRRPALGVLRNGPPAAPRPCRARTDRLQDRSRAHGARRPARLRSPHRLSRPRPRGEQDELAPAVQLPAPPGPPFAGLGVGVSWTELDYGDLWVRNSDPEKIATAAGLPNEEEVRRNLAATTTSKQGELGDRRSAFQALAGADWEISDAASVGFQGRYVRSAPFEDETDWERLRSYASQLRLDGSEAGDVPDPDRRERLLRGPHLLPEPPLLIQPAPGVPRPGSGHRVSGLGEA